MMRGAAREPPRRGARRASTGAGRVMARLRVTRRQSGGAGATRPSARRCPAAALAMLRVGARRRRADAPRSSSIEVALPEPRPLPDSVVGDRRRRERCSTGHEHRVRRSGGKGYPDLVRLRAPARSSARPTRSCCRPSAERGRGRCSRPARATASPWCRSAAAPASSAASSRSAGAHERVIALDLRRLRGRQRRRGLDDRDAGPGLRGPEAEAALGGPAASRSGTSRSRSSTRRSAASPPPARPGRPRPATGASTSWSPRWRWPRPVGRAAHAARRLTRPPARRCASSLSAPRASSGAITEVTVRRSAARRRSVATRPGWPPTSPPARELVRTLAQADALADVTRLSDEAETRMTLGARGHDRGQAGGVRRLPAPAPAARRAA